MGVNGLVIAPEKFLGVKARRLADRGFTEDDLMSSLRSLVGNELSHIVRNYEVQNLDFSLFSLTLSL